MAIRNLPLDDSLEQPAIATNASKKAAKIPVKRRMRKKCLMV
jgi:hypothetical protein